MLIRDVVQSYRAGLRLWLPLVVAHLFVRLVVASILLPLIGLALSITLVFSDQTALTDQDIAYFLLTPAGAIGIVVVLSMLITAAVLDALVATAILRQHSVGAMAALKLAAGFVLQSMASLVAFVVRFLIRVLGIVLPFALVAGVIAYLLLTEHDINYYLTEQPPVFLIAVTLIGLVVLALAATLLARLSGWAIAMHLSVFDRVAAARSFQDSRQHMAGHRQGLIGRLIVWLALRAIAVVIVGGVAGFVVLTISTWEEESLRALAGALTVGGLLFLAATALINAVANGALADLLNQEFDRALAGRKAELDTRLGELAAQTGRRQMLVFGAVAVVSLFSIGTNGLLAERLKREADVEIIAHRGAAAHAPENTIASVVRALDDGADWIEIDVQESADGEVIVVHDSDFMKSSRIPTKVWEVTGGQLADIDVGSWFDPAYADERVPLLSDVLEVARDRAGVIIELKYYGHDEDLERRVVSVVEDAGMADQIVTMSLKYPAVQKMRELRPDWRAGVLAATSLGDLSGLDGDFLALNQARINARVVQRAEAAGKDVYAWTVNDPMSIARMLWVGVDGLITDDPALARKVVDGYNRLTVAERLVIALSDRISIAIDREDVENARP